MAPWRLTMIILAIMLGVVAGCRTTTLATTWKDPAARDLQFRKVVAVVLNSSPGERRAQEDTLAANIKRAAVTPSHTFIPDDMLKDMGKSKQAIIDRGFDGAIILRLIDTRHETTYVPPTVSTWDDRWSGTYGPYNSVYDSHPTYKVTPGYSATDTYIRAEISLYAAPSGKLLWTGSSETMNPADARAFAKELLKAAADELRKQAIIR